MGTLSRKPERVEIRGGAALLVRELGWAEVGNAYEENRDPETGRLRNTAYQLALLKLAVVGYESVTDEDGTPLSFPARLDDLLSRLSGGEQRRVQAAAVRAEREGTDELGKSGPTSKG